MIIHLLAILFLYPYLFFLRVYHSLPAYVFLLPILLAVAAFNYKKMKPDIRLFVIGTSFVVLAGVSALYSLFPQNDAWYMVLFWFLRLSFLVYAYLFIFVLKRFFDWKSEQFFYLVIHTFFLHAIIAWAGFISPDIRTFFFSIQHLSGITQEILSVSEFRYRIPTFGMLFFGSGVLYSACLILIARMITEKPKSAYLWTSLFIIFFTGVCISRTTLIAPPLTLAILLISKHRTTILKQGLCYMLAFIGALVALNQIEKISPVIHWVTEPARFYLKYGSLGTDSVDETFATAGKALEIFEPESDVPKFSDSNTNIVTNSDGFSILSLGTGRLFSDDKTSYFGETDFGYLRVMLYGGIFYLILFYLPSFLIVGFSLFDRELKDFRLLFLSVLLVQMICNLKGMFEISGFLLLIFTALTMRDNSEA